MQEDFTTLVFYALFVLQIVQLHFHSFDIESCSDCGCGSVRIYDGLDTSAPLLRNLCGSSLPGPVTSSGNAMFVYFTNDGYEIWAEFSVQYSSLLADGMLRCRGGGVVAIGVVTFCLHSGNIFRAIGI